MSIALRLLSAVLAAALVALGALVAAEVVLAALDRPAYLPYSGVADTLRDNTWTSGLARAVGGVLCAAGLLLLVLALRRGRPAGLPLVPLTAGVHSEVSRRGLQRLLRAEADRVDGVHGAKVAVRRRKARVRARSSLRDTAGLPQRVEQDLRQALAGLALQRDLTLKVDVRRRT